MGLLLGINNLMFHHLLLLSPVINNPLVFYRVFKYNINNLMPKHLFNYLLPLLFHLLGLD